MKNAGRSPVLVEIAAAMLIISLVSVFVLKAFFRAHMISEESVTRTQAITALSSVAERIKNDPEAFFDVDRIYFSEDFLLESEEKTDCFIDVAISGEKTAGGTLYRAELRAAACESGDVKTEASVKTSVYKPCEIGGVL